MQLKVAQSLERHFRPSLGQPNLADLVGDFTPFRTNLLWWLHSRTLGMTQPLTLDLQEGTDDEPLRS